MAALASGVHQKGQVSLLLLHVAIERMIFSPNISTGTRFLTFNDGQAKPVTLVLVVLLTLFSVIFFDLESADATVQSKSGL